MAERVCAIVGDECTHPAGWQTSLGYASSANYNTVLRTKCYACGNPVCKKDSRLMSWHRVTARICTGCEADEIRYRERKESSNV
jgi:hypothetical protein